MLPVRPPLTKLAIRLRDAANPIREFLHLPPLGAAETDLAHRAMPRAVMRSISSAAMNVRRRPSLIARIFCSLINFQTLVLPTPSSCAACGME
jgi:hypothetical protein